MIHSHGDSQENWHAFSPSPLKVVNLEPRNRIVMAPMLVEKATREGLVTEELIKYYSERANNLGLQIIEATGVSKNCRWLNLLSIDSDQTISGLKALTDSIHRAGTPRERSFIDGFPI